MKKLLLTVIAGIGLTVSANAQLANASVWPNFGTFYDIHGVSHNIYNDLDSGYTVFVDISATWCNPCWHYHLSDALQDLYIAHGPSWDPNVSSSTTNDVKVYFFQGEPSSGLDELYGNGLNGCVVTTDESDRAHDSQGDWTVTSTGTPEYFPIVDDSSSMSNPVYYPSPGMAITYFPTVYMICRNHLVQTLTQPTAAQAYSYAQGSCPTYAPSAAIDITPAAYNGNGYFVCNGSPHLLFLNYSTVNLTTAEIYVYDSTGMVVDSQAWTGSVAPYDTGSVNISSVPAGANLGGYFYSVRTPTDTHHANDTSAAGLFEIYGTPNAATTPFFDNFSTVSVSSTTGALVGVNYKYYFPDPNGFVFISNELNNPNGSGTGVNVIGPDGSNDYTLIFNDYSPSNNSPALNNYPASFVMGNYNVGANMHLTFSLCYAPKSASGNTDSFIVSVSSDCGSSWTEAYSIGGAELSSTSPSTTAYFVPSAASDWKFVTVPLSAYVSPDLMVAMTGLSSSVGGNGELIYLDNLRISAVTSVTEVNGESQINMYPNPARDVVNIALDLNAAATVSIQVYDAVGRMVSNVNQDMNAGNQSIELSTENMATGIYNVKISAGNTVTTKQLSVIK